MSEMRITESSDAPSVPATQSDVIDAIGEVMSELRRRLGDEELRVAQHCFASLAHFLRGRDSNP